MKRQERAQQNFEVSMGISAHEVTLDQLADEIAEVYERCGFDRDATVSTLQMLTNIEVTSCALLPVQKHQRLNNLCQHMSLLLQYTLSLCHAAPHNSRVFLMAVAAIKTCLLIGSVKLAVMSDYVVPCNAQKQVNMLSITCFTADTARGVLDTGRHSVR